MLTCNEIQDNKFSKYINMSYIIEKNKKCRMFSKENKKIITNKEIEGKLFLTLHSSCETYQINYKYFYPANIE